MIGIGIDVGGTYIKMLALADGNKRVREAKIPTCPKDGPEKFVARIGGELKLWREGFGSAKVAAALGIAGDVDPERGVIRFSPNLCKWRGVEICGPLQRLTKIPCLLENDANMAAWGAYACEFKRKYDDLLAVTMGTGIGGGIIIGGRLYHGATGSAAEIGHIKIAGADGADCNCGGKGCLEAYTGQYGIVRRARALAKKPGVTALFRKLCREEEISPLELSRAADACDETALELWRQTGQDLGRGLAALCLVLNPDAVVLAGGVSGASRHFLPYVKEVFSTQNIETPFSHLKILASSNPDLGSLGAASLALDWLKSGRKNTFVL